MRSQPNPLSHLLVIALAVAACDENPGAPATVSATDLCEHLREEGCPQGEDPNCAEGVDMRADQFPNCEAERNELRRCYFIDLPAPDPVIDIEPGCNLVDACTGETDRLCWCERGFACNVEE